MDTTKNISVRFPDNLPISLLFGPSGGGKSHLAAALGLVLVERAGAGSLHEPPETSVLFELISAAIEHDLCWITPNQPFVNGAGSSPTPP